MGMVWGILSRNKDAIKTKMAAKSGSVVYTENKHVFVASCFHHLICNKKPCWKYESDVCCIGWRASMAAQMLQTKPFLFCSGAAAIISIYCANE